MIPEDFKIVIIGAGNVATRLGIALNHASFNINGVISKNGTTAKRLSETLRSSYFDSFNDIPLDTDLVLIATNDSSIGDVARDLPQIKGIVAHTSGSVPLDTLAKYHKRAAVIYPLQTFSRDVEVKVRDIPFFNEATDENTLDTVDEIVKYLSPHCHHADSAIRSKLHIAGVLSSNFPIYLLELTGRILQQVNLDLNTVEPLVKASLAKAFAVGPEKALTGPARRGDIAVIDKQINSLPDEYTREIYRSITNAILKDYHK